MEKNKEVIEIEEPKEEVVELKPKTFNVSLTPRFMNAFFAILALVLFLVVKILANFGVAGVFTSVMLIFIYGLAFLGLLTSYLKAEKPNIEFWFNLITFVIVVML